MRDAAILASMSREFRHGILSVWVLEELREKEPRYGYRLMVDINERLGRDLAIRPSQLYTTLGRLRHMGLVEAFHGTEPHGPIRRYYRLTPKGRLLLPQAIALKDRVVSLAARREAQETPNLAGAAPVPGARGNR